MDYMMKLLKGNLMIKICLWGMFLTGSAFIVLSGVSAIGIIATVGVLLMAIDFPRKEKRNKEKLSKEMAQTKGRNQNGNFRIINDDQIISDENLTRNGVMK